MLFCGITFQLFCMKDTKTTQAVKQEDSRLGSMPAKPVGIQPTNKFNVGDTVLRWVQNPKEPGRLIIVECQVSEIILHTDGKKVLHVSYKLTDNSTVEEDSIAGNKEDVLNMHPDIQAA